MLLFHDNSIKKSLSEWRETFCSFVEDDLVQKKQRWECKHLWCDKSAEMLSLNLISVFMVGVKMEPWLSLRIRSIITAWWLHASVKYTITGQRKSRARARKRTCVEFMEERLVKSEIIIWSLKSCYHGTLERQFVNVLHSQLISPATAYCLLRAVWV